MTKTFPAAIGTALLLAACGRSDLLPRTSTATGGLSAQGGWASGGAAGNEGTGGNSGTKGTATLGGSGGRATTPLTSCTICDDTCVDLQTDLRNCGGCGILCAVVAPSTAACANGRCLVTLAADQTEPAYPTVDAASLYWSTKPHGIGSVMKVPLAGGAPTTLASEQTGPFNVVVTATDIYWARSYNTILRAPLEGGAPTTIASGITHLFKFAVDTSNLYWALDAGTSSSVVKMPLAGGPRTTLGTQLHSGARALAVDGTGVYWTDRGDPDGESSVYRVSLDGGPITTLASKQDLACGLALDATHVYWVAWRADTGGILMKVPKTGGSPVAVASGPDTSNFVVDEANAYWTNGVGGVVTKVPLDGGQPTTLAEGQRSPGHITLDGTSVYWINYGSRPTYADGAVMRLSPK